MGASALQWYEARLDSVRLRALNAVERTAPAPREAVLAGITRELAAVEARLADSPSERERWLQHALGLDRDAVELMWTVVAVSHDPRVVSVAQVLGGGDVRRGATLALHTLIADLDGGRAQALGLAMSPRHPLLRHHLLISADEAGGAARGLHAPHRLAGFLAGDDRVDAAVAAAGGRVEVPPDVLWSPAQRAALDQISRALGAASPPLLVIEGPMGAGRRTALAAAGAATAIDLRRLAPTVAALEAAVTALHRECLLAQTLPVIAGVDDLLEAEGGRGPRLRALARALDSAGAIAVTTVVPGLDLGVERRLLRVTLPAPDRDTRGQLWRRGFGADAPAELDGVALRYRLGAGGIERAVGSARAIAAGRGSTVAVRDIVDGVRNDIAEELGGLAQRIETHQTWDDLVLTSDTHDQVRALIARVRLADQVLERWGFAGLLARGTGVAGLFSGPPGTGKTMVAGLIARELDLELYQVDLSKVVSKWVGETEKQLARIFAAAEAGHALLLFDEADSLFAKRTEVKAAVDRYANLEVNYLLQRIEAFGGVTILTTNMDTSIDPALRRRLAAHITFWPPDETERLALWKRMMSRDAPIEPPLDFEALAEAYPDMTGANIRNAVIAAAFLAASEGRAIAQDHLARAGKGEYRNMGRVLGK